MKKLTAIIILFVLVQSNIYAQDGGKNSVRGGGGYIYVGTDFVHMTSLDNSLRQYQLPEFGAQNRITFGGGGGTFFNRVYFGGYGEGHAGLSASNDVYETKIYGGQGLVQAGYMFAQNEAFAFYPTFGIGGGGATMKIDEGSAYSKDMEGSLLPPDSRIHTGYMLLNLGLNGDFFLGSKASSVLLIGISAGYQLAPLVGKWEYDGQSVSELDKYDPSGFYLRLKLGWARSCF